MVRFLAEADVPELLRLEHQTWTEEQATRAEEMRQRISAHPTLSMGAFCPRTGTALASLFLGPISLSSNDGTAVEALMAWLWPQALKAGRRDIYLGSPVPGLAAWRRRQHPEGDVDDDYVRARRHGLPADPQLRY